MNFRRSLRHFYGRLLEHLLPQLAVVGEKDVPFFAPELELVSRVLIIVNLHVSID